VVGEIHSGTLLITPEILGGGSTGSWVWMLVLHYTAVYCCEILLRNMLEYQVNVIMYLKVLEHFFFNVVY